jgi:hypothetical protein
MEKTIEWRETTSAEQSVLLHMPKRKAFEAILRGPKRLISDFLIAFIVRLGPEGGSLHSSSSGSSDLGCLRSAIVIQLGVEFDGFSISKTPESLSLNFGLVHKDIRGAIIGKNESESLHGIEPRSKD